MLDRIKQIMEQKGLTSTQFADGIDVPRAIVSHILSGRNKPSLDVVIKILEVHRDIQRDWLLLGEGDMLKKVASQAAAVSEPEQPVVIKEKPAPAEPAPVRLVEKVQSESPFKGGAPAPPSTPKAIERIIIFYPDKTFDTYSPSKE